MKKGHVGMSTHIFLQVGSKAVQLQVGDVIESPSRGLAWTITKFSITANTWSCSTSYGDYDCDLDSLADDLESGLKLLCKRATTVGSCDKSAMNCRKHKNIHRFGGYTNAPTGRDMPCPHVFGGKTCGVGWPTAATTARAPGIQPGQTVGEYFGNETPYSDPSAMEGVVTFPAKTLPDATLSTEPLDCDECFGTGLYKGMGGPCSHGCPFKKR